MERTMPIVWCCCVCVLFFFFVARCVVGIAAVAELFFFLSYFRKIIFGCFFPLAISHSIHKLATFILLLCTHIITVVFFFSTKVSCYFCLFVFFLTIVYLSHLITLVGHFHERIKTMSWKVYGYATGTNDFNCMQFLQQMYNVEAADG